VFNRLHGLSAGIRAYQGHPYRRDLAAPPVLWREGTTRLFDFRPEGGQPVLFVPSLINRAYILDLSDEHSLLRWLPPKPACARCSSIGTRPAQRSKSSP